MYKLQNEYREAHSCENYLRVPAWAQAEHMEASIPQTGLWGYSSEAQSRREPLSGLQRIFHRKGK